MGEPELEILYRYAPVGLCVIDPELRLVRVNQRFASMHGRSIDDVVGRPVADILHEAIHERGLEVARWVLEKGEPVVDLELNAPRLEDPGPERWWLVNCHPLTEAGAVTGIAVVVQDVTARKRIELEAARRLRELDSVYRNAPVGLAYFDRALRFVRVNEKLARMNGISVREHLGRTMREVIPPVADLLETLIGRIFDTGVPVRSIEIAARPPTDTGLHDYVLDCEPVKGPDGVVQGIVVAVHDATSLKRAEQEARARLEELESLYRNAPVGLCLIDRDLRFVRVNEQVARFNGIPASAHAGRPLEEVVPSAGQWALQAVARVLETGEPARDLEMRGDPRLPPEEQRRLRVDLEPATSEDGSVTGVIGVVHDVTALRQAEEEAHRLTELARARLEELEAVYALAPVGLILLDRQLRFVRVNERIAALTGRSASEHVGRPLSALPAGLADQLQPALDSVLATGSPVYDQRVATSAGSWLVNHHPVKALDGSVSGILTALQDTAEP